MPDTTPYIEALRGWQSMIRKDMLVKCPLIKQVTVLVTWDCELIQTSVWSATLPSAALICRNADGLCVSDYARSIEICNRFSSTMALDMCNKFTAHLDKYPLGDDDLKIQQNVKSAVEGSWTDPLKLNK